MAVEKPETGGSRQPSAKEAKQASANAARKPEDNAAARHSPKETRMAMGSYFGKVPAKEPMLRPDAPGKNIHGGPKRAVRGDWPVKAAPTDGAETPFGNIRRRSTAIIAKFLHTKLPFNLPALPKAAHPVAAAKTPSAEKTPAFELPLRQGRGEPPVTRTALTGTSFPANTTRNDAQSAAFRSATSTGASVTVCRPAGENSAQKALASDVPRDKQPISRPPLPALRGDIKERIAGTPGSRRIADKTEEHHPSTEAGETRAGSKTERHGLQEKSRPLPEAKDSPVHQTTEPPSRVPASGVASQSVNNSKETCRTLPKPAPGDKGNSTRAPSGDGKHADIPLAGRTALPRDRETSLRKPVHTDSFIQPQWVTPTNDGRNKCMPGDTVPLMPDLALEARAGNSLAQAVEMEARAKLKPRPKTRAKAGQDDDGWQASTPFTLFDPRVLPISHFDPRRSSATFDTGIDAREAEGVSHGALYWIEAESRQGDGAANRSVPVHQYVPNGG